MTAPRFHPVPRSARALLARTLVLALLALLAPPGAARAAPAGAAGEGGDPVARTYYRLLLKHTRWTEQQWDGAAGHYQLRDFNFAVVLGHAVLLRYGDYDAALAGVDRETLRARTLATIRHFAASNRLAGGSEWGQRLFWDTTFQSYFILAAKLLWDELDAATRANVDRIITGQAGYTVGLGTGDDPLSGGTGPNGLAGEHAGNTRLEEMGVYAQAIAPAVAWAPGAAAAPAWREWLTRWSLNASGLPPADEANPALVEGRTVAEWNSAHNIYDTFIVENHGTAHPTYQTELWRIAARNAAHFLLAGEPIPEGVTQQPNGRELWATMLRMASDAGEPFMPMQDDRYHLYGRDIIPLAYLAQVTGDRYAARAEADLAARMEPYMDYPPAYRLTKFSGEPKYEPEARAELAISYLFHVWRGRVSGGPVTPASSGELYRAAAGAADHGPEVGLVAHQTPGAFAASVSKPGYLKFTWAPLHDHWLFAVGGTAPSFLPATSGSVTQRYAVTYQVARDGFHGSASLFRLASGAAGYATLPSGTVVYATSGTGPGEGAFQLFNLAMPGVPGLDGDRTFTGEDGSVTLSVPPGLGDGGVDEVAFTPRTARYVRLLGARPATRYGYSLWSFTVHSAPGSPDLAQGQPTTASSYDPRFPPAGATDGSDTTRWAVAIAERDRPDSWLMVDLGAEHQVAQVRLSWEFAYGAAYRIQTSLDGVTWSDAAVVPGERVFNSSWLNVDGRAGFVVRASENPILVTPTTVTLSAGPATGSAGMVVEGYPGQAPAATRAAASRPAPRGGPATLAASAADGYLSLFNLGSAAIEGASLEVPQEGGARRLYRGTQVTTGEGTRYEVALAAGTARVEPPRFLLSTRHGSAVPAGLQVEVTDSRHARITNPGRAPARLQLVSLASGQARPVTVAPGAAREVTFHGGPLTPTSDLARARTAYPTSPLPAGMTDPDLAVDGDPATAWQPGPAGRMVVDLGRAVPLALARLRWTPGRPVQVRLAASTDGLTYQPVAAWRATGPSGEVPLAVTARYLAVEVPGWSPGSARLAELELTGG